MSWIGTAWLVPLYPLVGSAFSLLWSPGLIKRSGPGPAGYINLFMVSIAFAHSLLALISLHNNSASGASAIYAPPTFGWTWINTAGLRIGFDGLVSEPALIAMTVITGLHVLVQIYSIGYLEMDWGWPRFFGGLSFFEAGLCALVLTDSVFFSYVLLELLTVGTYVIVGTWYNQSLVVKGARDAFLTKRIGDIVLLAGVIALLPLTGTWNFHALQGWAADLTNNGQPLPAGFQLILLALIAGPMGKCAQFPMHLWLDEAMEGPNPASILRNSVVVTCGAIVLLKLMPIVALSPLATTVLLAVGTISAIGGALVALAQVDLKRAFSYSTTSYLGLVFIAIALQQPGLALLLLFATGLARALQFMSVGSIIATTNCQDLTELGGLGSRMPATALAFLVGSAGLVGLLPLGSFWCYGLMVDNLLAGAPLFAAVFLLTNLLTAANVVRVFRSVFLGPVMPKTRRTPEVIWWMALPMVSLAVIVLLLPWIMQRIDPVPGIASFPGTVALAVATPFSVSLPRGKFDALKANIDLPKHVIAPLAAGQKVGTLKISLDGKVVAEAPLVANVAVAEAGFFGRLWDGFLMWWDNL